MYLWGAVTLIYTNTCAHQMLVGASSSTDFTALIFSDAAETETCSFWIGWLATRVPDIPGDATLSPRAEVKSTPAMFDFYMGAGKSPLKLS